MEVADTIARHALAILLVIATLALAATCTIWRIIERYGRKLADIVSRAWRAVRSSSVASSLKDVPGLGRLLAGTLTVGRYLGIYALLAFALAGGVPGTRSRWLGARAFVAYALLLGTAIGFVRMAQGAHFLSHLFWSAWMVWAVPRAALRRSWTGCWRRPLSIRSAFAKPWRLLRGFCAIRPTDRQKN